MKTILRLLLLLSVALSAVKIQAGEMAAISPLAPGAMSVGAQRVLAEINNKRPKPLTQLFVDKIFRVTDFGAKPNSGADALPAVRAALAAAQAAGCPSEVVFAKGTYHFDVPEDGSKSCLTLENCKNLVLDGGGSEIVVRNPKRGFIQLKNCSNIIIKNFTVDYDPLPFTQGIVKAMHSPEGTFDVQIEPGFPPLDAPHLCEPDVGFLKDPKVPGRQKADVANFHAFTSVTRLPKSGWFRVQLANPEQIRDFAVRDRYVSIGRGHSTGTLVSMALSSQVTCQNIVCYAAPGANYVAWACDTLNVLGCQTKIRAGRWQSTNADGVHCQSNRFGPWIENCLFEGMADDGVNVYTLPFKLNTYPKDNWIPNGTEYMGRMGDRFTLFDPTPGRILDTFHIITAEISKRRFQLDRPLPEGLKLQDDKLTPSLYNQELGCPYTVIRNNVFKDFRGRGLLLKTHWSLVEGNRFEGVSNGAIGAVNNDDVPEGFQSEHLVIHGNQILDCGYDGVFAFARGEGSIAIYFCNGHGGMAQSRGQREIFIENNTIAQWRRNAVYLGGADQVQIFKNNITNDRDWHAGRGDPDVPFRVENADHIEIVGNTIKDTRNLQQLVVKDPNCGSIQTRDNTPVP